MKTDKIFPLHIGTIWNCKGELIKKRKLIVIFVRLI